MGAFSGLHKLVTFYEESVIKAKEVVDNKKLLLSAGYEALRENWAEVGRQQGRYARYSRPLSEDDKEIRYIRDADNKAFPVSVAWTMEALKKDATASREYFQGQADESYRAIQQAQNEYDDALVALIERMMEWYEYINSGECVARPDQVLKFKTYHKTFCRWVWGYKDLVGSDIVL